MKSLLIFAIAALAEISGCYTFWRWLRLGNSVLWLLPGLIALVIFATALTYTETTQAGRAYAAYGGVYILMSTLWLWLIEGTQPDQGDWLGVGLCLMGTAVILLSPHRGTGRF
ncbi:membrane protein [Neosynechococcus sphagnicola sy1]|uniref:Membrane protein n=1 Tax=Neosynechococcus sphagnicola sy1 TaxID=1497020 RepID=A0A098TKY8_9CYAN|nr:YnfA family protein [Neosynechococcus sphagnicola]KGF72951.1 membrane protein [Neosynechococcus sphagnicola sy1]